jgi:peroxiredoxin family protein
MHQGLSIAAAGAAVGRPVQIFLFWWALERVAQDRLDEPDLGPHREDHADRLEARGVPTLRQLLAHVRESGRCTVYACSGSLGALALTAPDVEGRVDGLLGWTSILSLTEGVTDRFYL